MRAVTSTPRQAELDEARARVTSYQSQQQSLDEQLAADEARLRVLRSDPIMRDANRLSSARDRAGECRVLMNEAAKRELLAGTQLTREAEAAESSARAG